MGVLRMGWTTFLHEFCPTKFAMGVVIPTQLFSKLLSIKGDAPEKFLLSEP